MNVEGNANNFVGTFELEESLFACAELGLLNVGFYFEETALLKFWNWNSFPLPQPDMKSVAVGCHYIRVQPYVKDVSRISSTERALNSY